MVAGTAGAVWARHILGRNWSGRVVVRKGHHLITRGPHRRVRHPIYAGVLLALFGTSLILGYTFSFVYAVFCVFGLVRKSKQEERLLAAQFPEEYPVYAKRTRMLLPFLY